MPNPHLLIIDDEICIRDSLKIYFQDAGFKVTTATDPSFCPLFCRGTRCRDKPSCADVVLTDLNMPIADGLTFLETTLRAGCHGSPRKTALMTARLSEADALRLDRMGSHYFPKPTPLNNIHAWIASILPPALSD